MSNTLIISETIFCDNEKNEDTLDLFLDAFKLNLISHFNVEYDEDLFEHVYIIYISLDKNRYKKRIEEFLQIENKNTKFCFQIVEYAHQKSPYGYEDLENDPRDKVPNRLPEYREKLFMKALEKINVDKYETIIRTVIDDDDLVPKWHFKNIFELSQTAQSKYSNDVIGLGMTNFYIVYDFGDYVKLEQVESHKAFNANKFFIVRNKDKLIASSPWGFPETVDDDSVKLFESQGTRIALVKNRKPGFFYIRRKTSHSNFKKDHFVEKKIGQLYFYSLDSICRFDGFFEQQSNNKELVDFATKSTIKIYGSIDGNKIKYRTNFDTQRIPGDLISIHVSKDNSNIKKTEYSDKANGNIVLGSTDGFIRLKVCLKRGSEIVDTYSSNRIFKQTKKSNGSVESVSQSVKSTIRIAGNIIDNKIVYETNLDSKVSPEDKIAIYVYRDGEKIKQVGYSNRPNGEITLDSVDGYLRLRVFLRREGKVIDAFSTGRIF